MIVAVGCDHAGLSIKESVLHAIQEAGHVVLDFGTSSSERVDFPDYAQKVGQAIQQGQAERGILLCGSGIGMCIAANKMKGIYAAICHDTYSAHQGVEHDNMNVLCLGGKIIGDEAAKELVRSFLAAHVLQVDRYQKRIDKIKKLEVDGSYPY